MLRHYFSALLVTAVTHAILACFVWAKGHRRLTNRTYAGYSASIALWSGVEAFAITATDAVKALWLWRINHIGVIFIPIFFVHFVVSLYPGPKRKITGVLVTASYLLGLTFCVLDLMGLLIEEVVPKFHFNYFITSSSIYPFFFSIWVGWAVYGLLRLFQLYFEASPSKKNQLSYFSISMLIAYLGGALNFLPTFNIEIPLLMPFGTYAVPIYGLFTAYAIVAYRLMEIEVIIRRTLVFAGLAAFVFGAFSFGLFLTQEVLAAHFTFRWEAALAISVLLIVLGYEPMRAYLIEATDKYLFQKKYDYKKFLKDASRGIAQIESLRHLLGLVIHFITMKMRVGNAAVLTKGWEKNAFRLEYFRGYPAVFDKTTGLSARDELIRYLNQEKEGIEIAQVKNYIQTGEQKKSKKTGPLVKYDFHQIALQMEKLQAACCVPSFLGGELRNVLVLGEKKSGEGYTPEDLNILFTIAQESAIAIENARLYDEAVRRSEELEKINEEVRRANRELRNTQAQLIHEQKMATLGRLAASVGHEVNNPLTILSMNVSRALLKYRKDPGTKIAEILDIFQKMEQNIGRIKAVVNTLTGLLKKSEKGKFEPLSLKLILEETLPLVQFQTYLEKTPGTEVEFDIPSDLPLVKGDLERLQEVFLNLFINAYHALVGRRNPKIQVKARLLGTGHRMVGIDFIDNGSGMPEEIQKKIFTYGFTTKGPGRGSGMGLYICKYIIELHGGEVRVQSRQGAGTTFTLTLPAFEETNPVGIPAGGAVSA